MADIKTLDCGCEVIVATNGSVMLTYCPKHKAAPDMYEACREAYDYLSIDEEATPRHRETYERLSKALTKAGGK